MIQEKNGMANEVFDAIVIGSGQGGNPLAVAMAEAGWKTAVVEREHVGGTCVNVGCTPTKTLVATARVAYLARRAKDFGVTTGMVRYARTDGGKDLYRYGHAHCDSRRCRFERDTISQ
jgi:pyruvate/2-oxoglutarate dehydrogenase complex dihydrolipoamide dehydrogenase (E3) component